MIMQGWRRFWNAVLRVLGSDGLMWVVIWYSVFGVLVTDGAESIPWVAMMLLGFISISYRRITERLTRIEDRLKALDNVIVSDFEIKYGPDPESTNIRKDLLDSRRALRDRIDK